MYLASLGSVDVFLLSHLFFFQKQSDVLAIVLLTDMYGNEFSTDLSQFSSG